MKSPWVKGREPYHGEIKMDEQNMLTRIEIVKQIHMVPALTNSQ